MKRRSTDQRRAEPWLVITAAAVVAGWSLLAAYILGWI